MTIPANSEAEAPVNATSPDNQAAKTEAARGEVSAQTVARLMGLTTQSDLKLMEGKLDLLVSRLGTISARLEKITTLVQQAPTVNDMERIDVQIGTLRSSMRELLLAIKVGDTADSKELLNKASKELDSLPEGFEQK